MLTVLTVGVLASVAAEIVVWLNKQLTNSVLRGKASFLLALVASLVGAGVKVLFFDHASVTDLATLGVAFSQVWTVAQVFFVLIVQSLKLDVQEG